MGTGQFRPGNTADPYIGKIGQLEEVPEVRVETICVGEDVARKAVEALKMQVSKVEFPNVDWLLYILLISLVLVLIRMKNPRTVSTDWRISDLKKSRTRIVNIMLSCER